MEDASQLSRDELLCITDKEFLLTKQSAVQKISKLLASTEKELAGIIRENVEGYPAGTFIKSGKISKGENYLGLPYLMLDYPRLFSEENTFAFRTMFWWGNFFSCTLQISGNFLEDRRSQIESRIESLKHLGVYLGVNDDPWKYHLGDDNYQLIDNLGIRGLKQVIQDKATIKVSRLLSLDEYAQLPEFACTTYQLFSRLVF
ncbi:MAG TPA: hypothetical protein PKC24_09230 [Cyclobacteriaceae bacterium]|nr:hypothetical protein [Cyclobacteriaceae bacterium]